MIVDRLRQWFLQGETAGEQRQRAQIEQSRERAAKHKSEKQASKLTAAVEVNSLVGASSCRLSGVLTRLVQELQSAGGKQ